MDSWSGAETGADSEGIAGLDSRHGIGFRPTGGVGADGVGAEGTERAADAESACGSSAGSGSASASASASGSCAYHETDDISDILGAGLGGLPTLTASGHLSVLSASAAEFTPGGQGQPQQQPQQQQQQYRPGLLSAGAVGDEEEAALHFGVEGAGEGEDGLFYAEVQLEAEVLEVMAESFSDCSLETLQVALAKSDWDLDRASAAVLSALETVCDPSLATKPCRHLLLNGECRRSDCAFSHDFATTTCRFWLQGECINSAESCHFLHDLDVPVPVTAGVCLHLDGDSPVPRTRWAREGDAGGGAGEWTPARGSDSFSDATADHFVNGGGDGVGGGRAPKTEEFPVLESKNASPSTKTSIVSGGVGDDQQNSRLQNPAAADTAGRTTGEVGGEGESEDEDELLAAVLVATRGGAGGGTDGKNNGSRRKVGRGRKTKFTPVDLQALLKPTTAPAAAPDPADEPRKMSSASASTNGQRASQPPHAWATPSTAGGLPARAVESGKPMSFADVVGSSPPPPPSATSASKLKLGAPGGAMRRSVIDGGSSSSHRSNSNSNTTRHGVVGVGGTGGGRGEWVSTGDAVREQYEQARKEAGELARARNKLFASATEAFRRGQGMVARDLARRGRELNVLMKEKHRQAASEIFASRNPGDQVFERRTIDLHGLHVSEAVDVLDMQMLALAGRGVSSVRVLTGTGHHSKGPTNKTRLIPAVEYFCHSRGFSLAKAPDRSTGHVGALDINFAALLEHQYEQGVANRAGGRGHTGGGTAAAYAYYGR